MNINSENFENFQELILQNVKKFYVPEPHIYYNKEENILYSQWIPYHIAIIIHEEGVMINSGETFLEYNFHDIIQVIEYQLKKLQRKLLKSTPIASPL